MNAVEIEAAVSDLAAQPFFNGPEFPFQFLAAFRNKETTLKRLRKGDSNKSEGQHVGFTSTLIGVTLSGEKQDGDPNFAGILLGMVRPCSLVVGRKHSASISMRKLVIETAKMNVIAAYSSQEAIDTLEGFPAVHGVVLDAGMKDMPCLGPGQTAERAEAAASRRRNQNTSPARMQRRGPLSQIRGDTSASRVAREA